ncbi:MAG: penicillin acylase family protein [SAR202 cluster bacterium]|nr:penicillin acylase family protein [SAR202 cluster bacterium]
MKLTGTQILERIGSGESITSICKAAGIGRREFNSWWNAECARRVPSNTGTAKGSVGKPVEITRDRLGIPHIVAASDSDLMYGFGVAMAQDRLWQLDWLRRRANGRLAEIFGEGSVESDRLARTVGLNRIAKSHMSRLPRETRRLLNSFAAGVNSVIDSSASALPIEFDLLGYKPEPWKAVDSVAVWVEFQWYLTGRFPVVVLPEMAKRILGEGPLYRAFLTGEADEESIVFPGHYSKARKGSETVGATVGDPDEGKGSNNWAVAGSKSTTGKPLVASDPHIAYGALSCWYEVHLMGGSFDVAGTAFVGVPAVLIGRTQGVAWGVTNNICSQRDLYQEKVDPKKPGNFLFDGKSEPSRTVAETIKVQGGKPVRLAVRYSRNGPIVDEVLPPPARTTGPVSLRWVGATPCDEITVFLNLNRAQSAAELRKAVADWRVPTWSLVFGDTEGHIGYQCVGRIPIRKMEERGYRPGWDPAHQWQGLIPYEQMPAMKDPREGFVRSANNRTAPPDYPYPLAGRWGSGHRARRIREILQAKPRHSMDDFTAMHLDFMNLRAVDHLSHLIGSLKGSNNARIKASVKHLSAWDKRMNPDSTGAVIFEAFLRHWSEQVAQARFGSESSRARGSQRDDPMHSSSRMQYEMEWSRFRQEVSFLTGGVGGLAMELLEVDRHGWFRRGQRDQAIEAAMSAALDDLEKRMGKDMSAWTWGTLHKVALRHPLTGRGDLGKLLDRGGIAVGGNAFTVGNTGAGTDYEAAFGANYRFKADLGEPVAWAIDHAGQSGHPGSKHYCDQTKDWATGNYHAIPLGKGKVPRGVTLRIVPTRG